MRFVIAIALFVASLASLVFGFLLKGPLADHKDQAAHFKIDTAYSYLFIPNDTLSKGTGKLTLTASGTDKVFYANARASDIQAWIGTSNFATLTLSSTGLKTDVVTTEGIGENANPANSDLWRSQLSVRSRLVTPVETDADTGVLLASDGLHRAPTDVLLTWRQPELVNWPMILIVGGLVLLVAAFIANYLNWLHIRKLRGPRRRLPRAPKGPKGRRYRGKRAKADLPRRGRRSSTRRKVAATALAGLTVAALAGCSGSSSVTSASPSASATPQSVSVVVTDDQLQRIVSNVVQAVTQGDDHRDVRAIQDRTAGPVYTIRKVHYTLQAKSKKIAKMPPLSAHPITIALPMQLPDQSLGLGWQTRTIMVATKPASADALPQLLVLQQASPRENYKLWYETDLLSGTDFPKVAAESVGAFTIKRTDSFLQVLPGQLPTIYGDVINKGSSSSHFGKFNLSGDQFYAQISEAQAAQKSDLTKAKANIKFLHTLNSQNTIGLSTLNGGGLIAVAMNDQSIIHPTKRGAAVTVKLLEQQLLLGSTGSATGLNISYCSMLLFYVPSLGSAESIRLLGATQGLLNVSSIR